MWGLGKEVRPARPIGWCLGFFAVANMACAQQAARNAVEFHYANDFFTATDRYYTQGVQLRHVGDVWARTPTAPLLLRTRSDADPLYGFFLRQDCYTPGSIRSDTIRTGDRPFAAMLYLGQEVTSSDETRGLRMRSQFKLGLLGPCAGCAEEQKWIHHGLGNITPLGWQYQVRTDVIANYGVEVRQRLFRANVYRVHGLGAVEVGTMRDALTGGLVLELGHPLRANNERDRSARVRFTAFGQADATAVAFDAALQGGPFQQHDAYALRADDVERIVLAGEWGGQLSFRHLDLRYGERYITRTFCNGLAHAWGTFSLQVRW